MRKTTKEELDGKIDEILSSCDSCSWDDGVGGNDLFVEFYEVKRKLMEWITGSNIYQTKTEKKYDRPIS